MEKIKLEGIGHGKVKISENRKMGNKIKIEKRTTQGNPLQLGHSPALLSFFGFAFGPLAEDPDLAARSQRIRSTKPPFLGLLP